jgi:Chaperone for protein-folding within the ER, fungal
VSEDELVEPMRTGISYSFTEDGFYESAWYRAVSNRMPRSSTILDD